MRLLSCTLILGALLAISGVTAQSPPNVGGCDIFPASWAYNSPIDTADVDPISECYIRQITADAPNPYLRLDMGNDLSQGYGIPTGNGSTGPQMPLDLNGGYPSESDCFAADGAILRPCCADLCTGIWKAPYSTPIEGQSPSTPNPTSGDRHTSYVDTDSCLLYETYSTVRNSTSNGWDVISSAIWDLTDANFPQRGVGWTSADAAGLPIFPGLMRFDEFDAGAVNHALRFTAENAQYAYVLPANHLGVTQNKYNLPYGIRLRLKASFDATGYTAQGQVLIAALKKYGMFFADQGTGFYISGTSNTGWDDNFFDEINQSGPGRRIHINNFEVIKPPTAIHYGYDAGSVTCNNNGDGGGDGGAASALSSSLMEALTSLY